MRPPTASRTHRRRLSVIAAFAAGTALIAAVGPAAAAADPRRTAETAAPYQVDGVRTVADRNTVARTGVSIDSIEHGVADISATGSEVDQLRRLGFTVSATVAPAQVDDREVQARDFPSSD